MTRILTDCPPAIAGCFDPAPGFRALSVASLTPPERALWAALSPATELFAAEADLEAAAGSWKAIAIVEESRDSQFDALHGALDAGSPLPESAACIALEGENFHGQRSRPWRALRGNLHLTTFHREDLRANHAGVGFSLLPTVAIVDVLKRFAGAPEPIGIKWVNDVLISGRKVAGAITATQVQDDRIREVILGAGLNIAQVPALEASPFVPEVTALAQEFPGHEPTLEQLLCPILGAFARRRRELVSEGCAPLLNAYREFAQCLGRPVRIWEEGSNDLTPEKAIASGRLLAIHDDLSLEIEGLARPVCRGRMALLED